jgi:hypothetical protein
LTAHHIEAISERFADQNEAAGAADATRADNQAFSYV